MLAIAIARCTCSLVALAVVMLTGRPALAGQTGTAGPVAETDVSDLARALRRKPPPPPVDPNAIPGRMIAIAPIIGAKPDTGMVFGAAGSIASFHGNPNTTHVSTNVFTAMVSQHGQTLTSVRLTAFTADDRWLIVGDSRFQWTSQDTFGLGTSSADVAHPCQAQAHQVGSSRSRAPWAGCSAGCCWEP